VRALIQRVRRASVTVDGLVIGDIGTGLVILLGVTHGDTTADAEQLAHKVTHVRIFSDLDNKMSLSVLHIGGELLIVPQFTLYADTMKGHRPSYSEAAPARIAEPLYEHFVASCRLSGIRVQTGKFQARMLVELINDGPVTIICDSKVTNA
jgi:D-aminoacyl-tRNA deacylase